MPRKLTEQLVRSKEAADVARYSAYVRDVFIFQQDSAPAHRAWDTIELLRHETPDFIGPDVWPANPPDLNPVDYMIWGLIQERVYQTAIQDTDDLKQRLTCVWAELKQSVVDKAIEQWRPRLKACICTKGHSTL